MEALATFDEIVAPFGDSARPSVRAVVGHALWGSAHILEETGDLDRFVDVCELPGSDEVRARLEDELEAIPSWRA